MNNLDKYNKSSMKAFSINKLKLKNLKYESIPNWDSVGHMTLMVYLEDAFKITMEMDDIIDFSSYEKGKNFEKI